MSEPASRRLLVTADDVAAFAQASGDRNPLHLDPEFAADTAFGACIAHGALVALAMLGSLPDAFLRSVRSLRVLFPAPVLTGEPLELTVAARDGACELRGQARGKTAVRVVALRTPQPLESPAPDVRDDRVPFRSEPAATDPARLRSGHPVCGDYEIRRELSELAARLGASALHPALLEALGWSSYLVGMELPGLHSLLAGLTVSTGMAQGDADADRRRAKFAITVRGHDERSGRVVMAGTLSSSHGDAATAKIDCFAMPTNRRPDLEALVPSEPAVARGEVALIGCSRGFGASLALALAARGFDVQGTYRSSPGRAAELAGLAGTLGSRADAPNGRLSLARCDAADPHAMAELAAGRAGKRPLSGLVLNAALPPLAMAMGADSGAALAEYVAASVALAVVPLGALIDQLDEHSGWILVASSAAVTAPPRDWPQYVAAKGALEGVAHWLAASRPNLRTVVVRLPKMSTSMTATPSGRIGAASADVVAAWTSDRLAGGELVRGLTMLEPEPEAVTA